jgi:hypothetical protein
MTRIARAPWTAIAASAVIVAAVAMPHALSAQGDYEIEVYPSATVLPRFFVLELQSNYVIEGQSLAPMTGTGPVFDQVQHTTRAVTLLQDPTCHNPSSPPLAVTPPTRPRMNDAVQPFPIASSDSVGCTAEIPVSTEHTAHELVELTAGVTSWSEIAVYGFALRPPGGSLQLAGGSARIKLRAPDQWAWPIGVALSTEIEHEPASLSPQTWTWEIRPIIDAARGRWYASINPTIERVLAGTDTSGGVQFTPSARIMYDVARTLTAGVEYYGAFGKVGAFASPDNRLQQFFGAVDLHVSPLWELNAGLGVGTTSATSHLVAKIVVGRRLGG